MTRQYMVGLSTTISAGTFRSLVSPLQSSTAFLVVPLVLLTAASDGLSEGLSPVSAMGVFLAALLVSGGKEELGWRAVLEPELERSMPFFAACLATGAIWGLWHLPLWFTRGAGREATPFIAFVALAALLSFWLSALYRVGGRAFSCCLLHALANTLIGVLSLSSISLVMAAALALTGLSLAALRYSAPTRALDRSAC
ncbi:CPBP family intramembrane glutamic endopeptidase [Paratractidigestivibacter faecalis]|uniref:CPBP family intramembrane glutamic endopeptidase n=1 Tax=Paratractidigestivibacter faecalis TaxID=2292441 RepID=A0ABV1IIN8_9ACTN